MRIILASQSPRRKEIMSSFNIPFECIPSFSEETFDESLDGKDIVMLLAMNKARDVFKDNSNALVIGSDTIVYLNHEVLGKPKNEEDCFRMLRLLSGKTHSVLTGVAFVSSKETKCLYSEAFVTFKELSDEKIKEYIQTKEPFDKAGGYAIQGLANKFVKEFRGDYYTIVGFPKDMVKEYLDNF